MYAARMAYCGPRGIALSAFLSWSHADQESALAWMAQEARRCRGCGTVDDDFSDPDAWHAETLTCKGCLKLESARATVDKDARGKVTRLARGPEHSCPTCSPR